MNRFTACIAAASLALGATAAFAQSPEDGFPAPLARLPHVFPTADEIANPDLYHPTYETEYAPPPASLPAPPPEGVVRPGEFEPMDSVVITVLNYGSPYYTMWRDMVDAYSDSTHTYIITSSTSIQNSMTGLFDDVGIPSDAYTYLDPEEYPVDAIWVRDYGPEITRTADGVRHITDFAYHPDRPNDDAIPAVIGADDWINADGSPMEVHANDHGVNGGNIVTDGAGTCFFSKILYGYEAPSGWSDEDVTAAMQDYLGCEQIITLNSICLDGTGHIDLYAKAMGRHSILLGQYPADTYFDGTRPSNVDYGHCENYDYPNDYQDQEDNLAMIQASTNLEGEPWVVTRMVMPEPYWVDDWGGYWVYRSYMNSQVVNGVVAMPSYYDPQNDETADDLLDMEAQAIASYEAAAPNGVEVFAIDSDHIIPLAGAIHCITHEIPAETDYEYTEPGDTDTDTDSDTDSDSDSDSDSDADADGGADAGDGETVGNTDDGCGCSALGATPAASFLSLIL